jgi:hypothetical protein
MRSGRYDEVTVRANCSMMPLSTRTKVVAIDVVRVHRFTLLQLHFALDRVLVSARNAHFTSSATDAPSQRRRLRLRDNSRTSPISGRAKRCHRPWRERRRGLGSIAGASRCR